MLFYARLGVAAGRRCITAPRVTYEFLEIRPRVCYVDEALPGEDLLHLLPHRPILPAPVPDGSSPAEVSECAPGYRPTCNRFPAP